MRQNLTFLGIDIGGAHIKLVGLDQRKKLCLVQYRKCYLWQKSNFLSNEIKYINSLSRKKNVICGITLTAELCDIFLNRIEGAKIIQKECEKIKFKKFFYSNSLTTFEKINTKKLSQVISMNWHSIGRFIQKHLKDGIVIDFGSTTTDFICIKDWQIKNNWFDDFYRINNAELMYTGVTRTPIFAICNSVKYNAKTFNIIPELFSTLSDVYRINGKINKEFDIDEETDSSHKNSESSYRRLARSFSLDYKKKDTKFIQGLSKKIMNNQLQKISDNIKFLQKKFSINRNSPVILSGIGQDILSVYLKNYKTILFKEFIENKNCNLSKIASYHAPATCIAHLLEL